MDSEIANTWYLIQTIHDPGNAKPFRTTMMDDDELDMDYETETEEHALIEHDKLIELAINILQRLNASRKEDVWKAY